MLIFVKWQALQNGYSFNAMFRKQMNMHETAISKLTFNMQVEVGHIVPDPSKRSATYPEDYG
jgi:hypothetical protein